VKDRGSQANCRPRNRRARRHDEDGAAAIEFAIVAGLLFMLVFGIIDFGFGFHTWNGTAHAAREGARFAAVDSTEAQIIARTRAAADFLDQSKMTVVVSCSSGGSVFAPCASPAEGDYIRVTVDYAYPYITPLPGMVGLGDDLMLHSQSEVRFEGV
jgi:Flp pilus assembly protein TadG